MESRLNVHTGGMPKQEGMIRFVCISDTHTRDQFNVPDGDVLLHAGDFTNVGEP